MMVMALVLLGAACVIAAIVGGGVKVRDMEIPTVQSLWRQLMLGGFGLLLCLAGAVVASDAPAEAVADLSNSETLVPDAANDAVPASEGVDPNAVDPAVEASDPHAAAAETAPAGDNSGG